MSPSSDISSSGIHSAVLLESLAPGSLIDVETKSRHYRIECLGGNAIRISGHPSYCPEPTAAHLQGSIDKEGVFNFGQIGPGMRLMVMLDDRRPVTTSSVVKVRVERPSRPKSTTSIH